MLSYFQNRKTVLKQGLREGTTNIYCLFSDGELKLWEEIKKTETVEVQNMFLMEALYTRSHHTHISRCGGKGRSFVPMPLSNNIATHESFVVFGLSQFLARGKNIFIDQNQVFDMILTSLSKQINLNISALQNLSIADTITATLNLRQKNGKEQLPMFMTCKKDFEQFFNGIAKDMHVLFVHALVKINDLCPHAHEMQKKPERFQQIVQQVLKTAESLVRYFSLDCTGTLARYLIVHFHNCTRMADFEILRIAITEFMQFLKDNSENILPGCDDIEKGAELSRLMCAVEYVSKHVSSNVVALYKMSPSQMIRELQVQLLWPKYMNEFMLPTIINNAEMPHQFFMASLFNDICSAYPQCRTALHIIFMLCYTEHKTPQQHMPILTTAFHDILQDVTPERLKYVISELEELALLSVVMFKDTNNFNDEMVRFQKFCHGLAPDVACQVTFDDFVHTVHSYCVSLSFHINMDQKMLDHANDHDEYDDDDTENCQSCQGLVDTTTPASDIEQALFNIGAYSDPESGNDSEHDNDKESRKSEKVTEAVKSTQPKLQSSFFYDLAQKNNLISNDNNKKSK